MPWSLVIEKGTLHFDKTVGFLLFCYACYAFSTRSVNFNAPTSDREALRKLTDMIPLGMRITCDAANQVYFDLMFFHFSLAPRLAVCAR